MNHETYVIYHRLDFDGLISGTICKKFMPDANMIGWTHGDEPIELPSGCSVFVVDLGLDCLAKIEQEGLTWIDHHPTGAGKWPNSWVLTPGMRLVGVAACRLCWQWFTGQHRVAKLPDYVDRTVSEPLLVRLAGEFDVWDKRDPRAEQLQYALTAIGFDVNDVGNLLGTDSAVRELVNEGRAIENYAKALANQTAKAMCYRIEWEGFKFLVLNQARGNSLSFGDVPTDVDALMLWRHDGKQVIVSLYAAPHTQGKIDLSVIAKKYGGGGHPGACGLQLPLRLSDWARGTEMDFVHIIGDDPEPAIRIPLVGVKA